ncbi:tetratricopeptide repeat protein [Streptomyces sp. NPDC026665]|uniref:tetratricopeptide repeat protein n=1 Tax=Streptomyces sp. NPDC026665 TaxID=3154798 RepID=UPI003408474E
MTPLDDATALQRVLMACLQALADGDHHSARHLADRALGLAATSGPPARANALLLDGMVEQAGGDTDAAAGRYAAAAELAEEHLAEPEGIQLFLHAKRELAALHRGQGRYRQAEQILQDALAALATSRAAEPASEDLAMFHNEFGMVCKYSGNFDQAAVSYETALTLVEAMEPVNESDLADIHHNLGGLAHARGDYAAAEGPARRAVAIRERALGPSHPEAAADRAALAPILLGLGHLEEAEALLEDALAVFGQAYGTAHVDYVIALGNLAAVTHRLGRHQTAEALYRQTLRAMEESLGPGHPDLVAVLANLADLNRTLGNSGEAHSLEMRARAILAAAVRPDHPDLGILNT